MMTKSGGLTSASEIIFNGGAPGEKTYSSPVVVGYLCGMGIVRGSEMVYLNDNPLWDVDHPVGGVTMPLPK